MQGFRENISRAMPYLVSSNCIYWILFTQIHQNSMFYTGCKSSTPVLKSSALFLLASYKWRSDAVDQITPSDYVSVIFLKERRIYFAVYADNSFKKFIQEIHSGNSFKQSGSDQCPLRLPSSDHQSSLGPTSIR